MSAKTLPLPKKDNNQDSDNPALTDLRKKVINLYDSEPDIKKEEEEIKKYGVHSKHQKFLNDLQSSNRSNKEKQIIWHNYYTSLNSEEKKKVWNEYYEYQSKLSNHSRINHDSGQKTKASSNNRDSIHRQEFFGDVNRGNIEKDGKASKSIRNKLKSKLVSQNKLKNKKNLQSIVFGMSMGLVVLFIFMFGFFNERFIAPFITPSKTASSSPIIIDPNDSGKVGPEQKVIIPKINVDVPVVYNLTSNDEDYIQNALNDGVVHYPGTAVPGQKGNVVIVGHSSNNIFNPGSYKFAFVLLNRLQEGDTFILNYNSQRYVYKIYKKEVVKPNEVRVMAPQPEKESVASLITCDPPGTDVNRLVVFGEQIFPSPDKNLASDTNDIASTVTEVPGNSPSLLGRIFGWQ